jgi:hypothetical protein
VTLDFDDASAPSATSDVVAGESRDRAFSFECFAFGINADEPLPPMMQTRNEEEDTGRPRGDSIIFDPSSFQDGGIHEQSALFRVRATSEDMLSVATKTTVPPPPQRPDGVASSSRPSAGTCNTTPASSLAATLPDRSGSSSTTATASATVMTAATTTNTTAQHSTGATLALSLELVNQDGRIGIYLPEARRQRIARFHAKRANRIWRKRIKYDCRKKLADSRPRIKGRFVKRSDMDDDDIVLP